MKTVNKQFLENQVRLALNEIGMSDGALSTGQNQGKEEDSGFDFSGLAMDIFLGAEASREQVMDLASSSLKYGLGPQSHIKRAINSTKSIGAFESFVFKFIKTAPLNSNGDVNITWNEELFTLIYSQCDKSAKEIEKKLNAGKTKDVYLVFKDFIQNKIFDNIFDKYGITDKSNLGFSDFFFVGSERKQVKTTFKPDDKWCQQFARRIEKGSSAFDISRMLERAICETSYALRKTPSGKQAVSFWDMQSEAVQSNIPKIVAATVHAEYSRSQSEPMTAFISVADVTLSVLGTMSIVLSFGSSIGASKIGSSALRALGGRLGAANAARAAKLGIAMRKAVAVNKVVGGWKFTIGDIIANVAIVGYQIYNAFDASLQRLTEKTTEYFDILGATKDKEELQDLLEGIRNNWITVIDQFIKIQKTYVDGMNDPEFKNTATGLLDKTETEGKEAVVKIMELYKSGNRDGAMQRVSAFVEFSKKVEKVAKRAKDQSGQIKGKVDELNSSLQEIENKKKQINQETLNALKPTATAAARAGVADEPAKETPPDQEEQPISQEVEKNNFGSNEKTSAETLRDIEEFLSQIQERNSSVSKEILVNLGNKDALEFSKGNTQFSPEQTINNIKKISDLAKSKGVVVKFSPIPKLLSSQEGVDNEKYNSFAKQINGHMQGDQKTTTPDPSQTSSVAPVAQGAPVVKKKETEAEAETEADEEEEEKSVSMPPAEAAAKFEKRTNEIDSLENFKEIVVYMTELYGTMVQTVKNNLVRLKAHVEDINASDLTSYRNNKFKELTSNVHRKNRSKLFSLYKTEKEKDEESANRLMALLHRPRLVTYISTDYLLYTTHDGFNLSFELGAPHGNKVGVALRKRDFLRNSSFGDGIEKQELKRILIQNRDTFIRFKDKLLSFGPGELEGGDFGPEDNRQYLEFLSSYIALFNAGIEALEDKGSALRRSWIIDNLSAAIYLLS
tara:strand:- start:3181 stop:6063 length:2883 start_codon:yes stop_codon:yes gene_type:complete